MKLTKQRLREIILEEIGEIDVQSQEEDPERLLRREIRESKRALAAAIKQFVTLQNYALTGHEEPTMGTEPGPGMLRKFVDNWLREW
tara:strand:- start:289 stop:549 length:261 start_codon:yes stop_codon:yes gene_type:complete